MKKYTIKEFAEGKKAVKIENIEQWNKLNKVHKLTSAFYGKSFYDNTGQYSSVYYTSPGNGYEILEFSQLDFEDEFVVGKWYKIIKEGVNTKYIKYLKTNSSGYFHYSEHINSKYQSHGGTFGIDDVKYLTKASLEEIQQFLPEGHIDLIKKDTFVLSEKWCIRQDTSKEVCDWFNKKYYMNSFQGGAYDYLVSWEQPESEHYSYKIPENTIEITFEQFKTHILKEKTMQEIKVGSQFKVSGESANTIYTFNRIEGNDVDVTWGTTHHVHYYLSTCLDNIKAGSWILVNKEKTMEKEIIGFKLKYAEYKKAALKICNTVGNWENSLMEYDISVKQTRYVNELKEAGVLDLWFEPVFAPDKPKLPTINGKRCVDNGDKTITCGCTTKSFDWILGVEYAMGDDIYISDTKVTQKEIKQIVEYINNK